MKKDQINLEREAIKLRREEQKFLLQAKKAAQRGDTVNARSNAKLVLQARKSVEQLMMGKASLNSVCMQMKQHAAMVKVAGVTQTSTGVMQSMQAALRLPSIAATARNYAMEMDRAGLLEEMASDVMTDAVEMAGEAGDVDEEDIEAVVASLVGTPAPAPAAVAAAPTAAPITAQPAEAPPSISLAAASALPQAPVSGAAEVRLPTPTPMAAGAMSTPVSAASAGGGSSGLLGSPDMTELERRLAAL